MIINLIGHHVEDIALVAPWKGVIDLGSCEDE